MQKGKKRNGDCSWEKGKKKKGGSGVVRRVICLFGREKERNFRSDKKTAFRGGRKGNCKSGGASPEKRGDREGGTWTRGAYSIKLEKRLLSTSVKGKGGEGQRRLVGKGEWVFVLFGGRKAPLRTKKSITRPHWGGKENSTANPR